jgi:DNA-binding MarR family transcriptional regulator
MRSASATVLVNRLESAGDVSRYPDPADGRRIVPRLTDSARTEFAVENGAAKIVRAALVPLPARMAEMWCGAGDKLAPM